jgi:hypothetical protein
MFFVEIGLSSSDQPVISFWISSYGGDANNPEGGEYPCLQGTGPTNNGNGNTSPNFYGSGAFTSLLSAVKTWAEGYDWATFTSNEENMYQSITITEYAETSTNVTP